MPSFLRASPEISIASFDGLSPIIRMYAIELPALTTKKSVDQIILALILFDLRIKKEN